MRRLEYNTDGADIYRNSLTIIHEESGLSRFGADEETATVRMIRATGQADLAKGTIFPPGAVYAVHQAFEDGTPILTDVNMIALGITRKRLPADNGIICLLCDGCIPELARELGTTRTAAAVELWKTCLEGAAIVIGNAPTTLFHLSNRINEGFLFISTATLAMPVGSIGTAESKRATIDSGAGNPELKYITVTDRRGGPTIACTALSATAIAKEIL